MPALFFMGLRQMFSMSLRALMLDLERLFN